ncbi:uncharacterized protein TrAtP1_002711 [Trichoderma atroviride]|uniref:uncharacterized protein n=1 Tax=Hypocrea atroviridis TaxID=63577 RepID=UPI003321CC71|nr:hypothetical protein TrAtP1_002711 [Trichoderma atroviride]
MLCRSALESHQKRWYGGSAASLHPSPALESADRMQAVEVARTLIRIVFIQTPM